MSLLVGSVRSSVLFFALLSVSQLAFASPYYWVSGTISSGSASSACNAFRSSLQASYPKIVFGEAKLSNPAYDAAGKPRVYGCTVQSYMCASGNCNDLRSGQGYYMTLNRAGTSCTNGQTLNSSGSCSNGEPGKNTNSCPQAGNPIQLLTGNKVQTEIDFSMPGAGLSFERHYDSSASNSYDGALGFNWTHNYSSFIRNETSRIFLKLRTGDGYFFKKDATGSWKSDADVRYIVSSLSNGGWQVKTPANSVLIYSPSGLLVSETEITGTSLSYQYGNNGILKSVTNSFGQKISFLYDSKLYLIQKILSPVLNVSYEYDAIGNLVKVSYIDVDSQAGLPFSEKYYRYEDSRFPHALTGIVDELGRRYGSWTYNDKGWAVESQHGAGFEQTLLDYALLNDLSTPQVTVTNAFGKQSTYHYMELLGVRKVISVDGAPSANCVGTNSAYTYTSDGLIDTQTDNKGNVTDYDYSASGLVIKIIEGLRWTDASRTATTTTPDTRVTEKDWNETTRQLVEERAPGFTTHYDYWPNNRVKQVTQTDTTTQSNVFGSTQGQQRITSYSYTYYNGAGLPVDVLVDTLTIDGPLAGASDTTAYKYDPQGRLLSITNAAGQVQQFADLDGRGQPQTITDVNGVVTALGYHPRGWLETVSVKDPGGNSGGLDATTTYTWYPNGTLEQLTFPDGSYLHYTYNDARHLIEIRNNLGEKITYTPNAMGEWVASKTYDTSATMKRLQTRAFDELGRLMDLFGNNGQQTHYGYDTNNNLNTVVESGDNRTLTTTMNHDTLNRLQSVLKPVTTEQNGSATTVTVNTQYGYDAASNLTSVTDPKGNVTRYVYNGFSDKITQTSPDTGVTQYGYDALGNLTDSQDGRGVHVQYHHDVLGRLTWIEYPTSSDDVHYYYDEVGAENPYASGRLTRITDGTGSTQYRYDHRGNIVGDLRTIGTNTFETRYTYNLANNLTSVTYPGGRIVSYARSDVLGRVTGLSTRKSSSEPEQTVLSQITYLPFGPVTQFAYGNGLTRQVPYDLDYRIDQILVSGNVTPLNLDYGYDAFNNITSIFNGVDNVRSETFSYDDLHRLQHAYGFYLNGNGQMDHIRYEYDAVGNRTTRELSLGGNLHTAENYSYDPLSNQLNSVSLSSGGNTQVRSLLYGDSGHLASETTAAGTSKAYTYNDNNRLIELAEDNIVQGDYRHNALGQRVSKTTGTSTTHYLYGLQGELLAEASEEGQVLRQYLYLNGQLVGVIDVTN